jgi:hypothetical protein
MKKRHFCIAIATYLIVSQLYAQNRTWGLVEDPLVVAQSGVAMFGHVTADTVVTGTRPSCSTASLNSYWTLDLKTPGGRAAYAVVLQAHALGRKVAVQGLGNCNIWGDRESVDHLYIH